jgi:hypothetical protein
MHVGVLQTAAASAVIALAEPAGVAAVAPLVESLRARAWSGDAELLELLSALSSRSSTGRRGLPVDLDMLNDVLSNPEGGYLDLETGNVWPMSIVDDGQVEGLAGYGDDPDPQRWLDVVGEGSREAYQDMVDFTEGVSDERTHDDLSTALGRAWCLPPVPDRARPPRAVPRALASSVHGTTVRPSTSLARRARLRRHSLTEISQTAYAVVVHWAPRPTRRGPTNLDSSGSLRAGRRQPPLSARSASASAGSR